MAILLVLAGILPVRNCSVLGTVWLLGTYTLPPGSFLSLTFMSLLIRIIRGKDSRGALPIFWALRVWFCFFCLLLPWILDTLVILSFHSGLLTYCWSEFSFSLPLLLPQNFGWTIYRAYLVSLIVVHCSKLPLSVLENYSFIFVQSCCFSCLRWVILFPIIRHS